MSRELARRVENRDNYRALIRALEEQVSGLLPKVMPRERFLRIALMAASRTPKLLLCTGGSISTCLIQAAELGLPVGPTLGMFYLIPRRNKSLETESGGDVFEATALVGYKGWAELARRSGEIGFADADVVYDCDKLVVKRGLYPDLTHEPDYNGARTDEHIVGAYAVVGLKGVERPVFAYLPLDEIKKRRARSASKNDGPWVTDFAAMCRKSAILALLKGGLIPLSTDAQRALEIDPDAANEPQPEDADEVTQAPAPAPAKSGADRVRAALPKGDSVPQQVDPGERVPDVAETDHEEGEE